MKLPEQQLAVYLGAGQRADQAAHRLGTARLEFLHYERLAIDDWKRQQGERDAAVQAGLEALGLPWTDPQRHFHVLADGSVKELVAGQYIEPREGAVP